MDWRRTRRKLVGKILTLLILAGCLWFVRSQPAYAFATCESCAENFYMAMNTCDMAYNDCMAGGGSTSGCYPTWLTCSDNAKTARDACVGGCTFASPGGSGGGGGGGGRTKTPCEQACYALRHDCASNGGNPDIQECLDSGETVIWCCHLQFTDCMAGCH